MFIRTSRILFILVFMLGLVGLGSMPVGATSTYSIDVNPTSGLVTTEAGGTATFNVSISYAPTADVTFSLYSSNTLEGTINKDSLRFTSSNWNTPQTVTITGVDDAIADGNKNYTIVTGAAVSGDNHYNGVGSADVSVTNNDNDLGGFTVNPTTGLSTTEAGGSATFTVVLTGLPTANVTIGLSSSDTTEGTVSPASLTFTSANWNIPQTVTVTGVDDLLVDGDIAFQIVTAAADSTDAGYNGLNAVDVGVTNNDNDETPVAPIDGIASFVPDNPNLLLSNLTAVNPADLPTEGRPARIIFPQGLYSFTIGPVNPGATVVVTATFPNAVPAGSAYWKYSEAKGWVNVTNLVGSNDGDNILTLTLTDGGAGDMDGLQNGSISDPGGPVSPVSSYSSVGGQVAGINRWGMLTRGLGLLLIIAGCVVALALLRRKKLS